jgi:integrase
MTGSTYIEFDRATSKGLRLIKTGENPAMGLLIICGINMGLRIADLLTLTYFDLNKDTFTITEQKTGKKRVVKVNDNIKSVLRYFKDNKSSFYCFRSQKGSVYSRQHVNRLLKEYFNKDTTSHSLRKSFGRRVWDNYYKSDEALVYLSEIFNHSSPSITRKYLGIRQQEINNIYDNL